MKIAITGIMGSGKTTLAERLQSKYGFYHTSIAKRLKELAKELFHMEGKDRKLLIDLAAKMREIDDKVWTNTMLAECKDYKNVVVDDLRLTNEYEMLKKRGWFIVKVEITNETRIDRLWGKYGRDAVRHLLCSKSITENDVATMPDEKFDFVLRDDNYESLLHIVRNARQNEDLVQ